MRKSTKILMTISIIVVMLFAFAGCNNTESTEKIQPQIEKQITMQEGETLQLNANTDEATWSSSNETVATVSENGLVTAISDGMVKITLEINDQIDVINIIIKAKAVEESPVVYAGMTAEYLDNLPTIHYDEFQKTMDDDWNFGWNADATSKGMEKRVDFSGEAPLDSKIWRAKSLDGVGRIENAGYGVTLWAQAQEQLTEGADICIYNKLDIPSNCDQFRIWAASNTNQHWSGCGAFRAVALYKNASGDYEKTILNPKDTVPEYITDGYVKFKEAAGNLPGAVGDEFVVYDMTQLRGKSDVVIVIEADAAINKRGTEETEVQEGVLNGNVMPDTVIIKRIMFLKG